MLTHGPCLGIYVRTLVPQTPGMCLNKMGLLYLSNEHAQWHHA